MIGHNKNIKAILGYLENQDRSYNLSTTAKEKAKIQHDTNMYMNDVNDDLYADLTDGSASGLFGSGHSFKQDMAMSLMKLRNRLNED